MKQYYFYAAGYKLIVILLKILVYAIYYFSLEYIQAPTFLLIGTAVTFAISRVSHIISMGLGGKANKLGAFLFIYCNDASTFIIYNFINLAVY